MNEVLFQILDWRGLDEGTGDVAESSEEDPCKKKGSKDKEKPEIHQYIIKLFGRTDKNETIYIKITDYNPFFYVKINEKWREQHINIFIDFLKKKAFPKNLQGEYVKYTIKDKYEFYEFNNFTKFKFLRIECRSKRYMQSLARVLDKKQVIPGISNKLTKYKTYECNFEPLLRCMHIRDISANGWVKINKPESLIKTSHCQKEYEISWLDLNKYDSDKIQPFIIAAFDIECVSEDGSFPLAKRDTDKIIQIGVTYSRLGESECFKKYIATLNTCNEIPGAEIECFKTEKGLLLGFTKEIIRMDPDILTGHNIFGFDFTYLKDRAHKLGINDKFAQLSRIKNEICNWTVTNLSSSALGDNKLQYYDMTGRVLIDMMKVIQREHKLESYKLDYAASYFIKEKVKKLVHQNNNTLIETKSNYGIEVDQYITINYDDGITLNKHQDGAKFKVIELISTNILVNGLIDNNLPQNYTLYWCQVKDDIRVNDIFRFQKGTDEQRAIIAKYCIQDCALCNKLMAKLQVLSNHFGMANVCHVPLSYLFFRGQSIKIYSLMLKECGKLNHLIPYKKKKFKTEEEMQEIKDNQKQKDKIISENKKKSKKFLDYMGYEDNITETGFYEPQYDEDGDLIEPAGYEGATVFEPVTGAHFVPVAVLDYGSLYPSCMIEKNLSHEMYVRDEKYLGLEGYRYHKIVHREGSGEMIECIFAEKLDNSKGIIPQILTKLLGERKRVKKLMEAATDSFSKAVYDGLQLAFKVTANSLYGATGAEVSPVYLKAVAASTTATGRERLQFAKYFIENIYRDLINFSLSGDYDVFHKFCLDTFTYFPHKIEDFHVCTDEKCPIPESKFKSNNFSNREEFFTFVYNKLRSIMIGYTIDPRIIYGDTDSVFFKMNIAKDGVVLQNKEALEISIKLGDFASCIVEKLLPYPQVLVYEKNLWPFALISKKRYVGNLYEHDPNEFKQKSMGIVLKRRDNAPIVKIVCGGVVHEIINNRSASGAVEFVRKALREILSHKYPIEKYIITKTLKGSYKDRSKIAHAVLADRMGIRDPGNKPEINDRLPYVYICVPDTVELQGDRIEHPDYVIKNNLKIDYLFYITNQIMKPTLQFLELLVENPEKIFNEYIIREENIRKGVLPIEYFIKHDNQVVQDQDNPDWDPYADFDVAPLTPSVPKKKKK